MRTAGLASLLVVLLTAGCGLVASDNPPPTKASTRSNPKRTAIPGGTSTRAGAPVSPSAGHPSAAPQPAPSRAPNRTLKQNSLYLVDLHDRASACRAKVRSPRPPLPNAALAPYLRKVVDCLVKAFAKPLATQGIELSTPKVKTYRGKLSTPCGRYGQDVAPAYYCAATQTIYWPQAGDDGREAYTVARLGYVGLLAHEFGHHLQAVSGLLNGYAADYYATKAKSTRNGLGRRLELQAQCFEGVFLAVTRGWTKLSARDRAQLRLWHDYTGDQDPPRNRLPDHGTSAAQLRWLKRGIDSADFGSCNTWKASKKSTT
jgi:hypothetical protein